MTVAKRAVILKISSGVGSPKIYTVSDEPIRAREKCYPAVWLMLISYIIGQRVARQSEFSMYRKRCNKRLGSFLISGPLEGGGGGGGGWRLIRERGLILKKFFDRQRQNYTMSMEFEMLC